MRIAIHHTLTLTPPAGAGNLVCQLLLTPASGPTQRVESWRLAMPGIEAAARFRDAYGNAAHMVNRLRPEGAVTLTIEGLVETLDTNGVLGKPAGEPVPALYTRQTAATRVPAALPARLRAMKDDRIALLHALMARLAEPAQTQTQTQTQAQGQSQAQAQTAAEGEAPGRDAMALAHAFVGAARALDIPARYVTGWLLDAPTSGFHAWAEAHDPALGWIGFDPFLQLCPAGRHVRLAAGLDAASAAPLRAHPPGTAIATAALEVGEAAL